MFSPYAGLLWGAAQLLVEQSSEVRPDSGEQWESSQSAWKIPAYLKPQHIQAILWKDLLCSHCLRAWNLGQADQAPHHPVLPQVMQCTGQGDIYEGASFSLPEDKGLLCTGLGRNLRHPQCAGDGSVCCREPARPCSAECQCPPLPHVGDAAPWCCGQTGRVWGMDLHRTDPWSLLSTYELIFDE